MNVSQIKIINSYPERNLGLLLAGVTAFCWSILAIILKYALEFTDSATIVWARMFTAFLLLTLFIIVNKSDSSKIFNFKLPTVFAGLFLAINYFGYMKGIELTSASNAQVMIQMAPTLLIIIGLIYFKEKITLKQIVGIFIAAVGFYYFYQTQLNDVFLNSNNLIVGNSWIVVAAITWAIFGALQKLSSHKTLNHFNLIVYLTAAIALTPGAALSSLVNLSIFEIFVLFILGLNTVIAYGCFGLALKKAPASQVSLIIVLNPMLTLFIIFLMNTFNFQIIKPEPINLSMLIGAILVVIGVGLALIKYQPNKL